MFLKPVDLTTALRPSLLPDETLLFVQDAVGLYQGKYKIPSYQNGHAYLTSLRVCYVDDEEPRKYSVGIDLKDVDRYELQAGFLKSSPKITIYPKPQKRISFSRGIQSPIPKYLSPPSSRSSSPFRPSPLATPKPSSGTWICPICSFSNSVPSNFDPATANASTPLAPCLACGIKPPLTTILKAAIAAASGRSAAALTLAPNNLPFASTGEGPATNGDTEDNKGGLSRPTFPCPRCTFLNHPSMTACEICGAPLTSSEALRQSLGDVESFRPESPGPLLMMTDLSLKDTDFSDGVKLSFREGGEKIFHERLKNSIVQRKWLLQDAPPIPKQPQSLAPPPDDTGPGLTGLEPPMPPNRSSAVGIAGLERRGLETRKNNEVVIGNAFEDLEALMASAKDIVALAETFAAESGRGNTGGASTVLSQSAAALGMITTKDMLGTGGNSENLYLSELSRNLAEYLTDDTHGILRREGGIMSLIDIWAIFNRSRNGVELISPTDFQKAAQLWEKLKLPVRLRKFKSDLLVVQRYDWSDEKTIGQFMQWLEELRAIPPEKEISWDWRAFGRGVTAQEAAQRFGWSVGVASEELEMAEDRGFLCREEGIEGLRFWSNLVMFQDLKGFVPAVKDTTVEDNLKALLG